MARNPRAPVFFSSACEAIALSASSVNVNSTLSKSNNNLNCLTVLFLGSVRIRTSKFLFKEWNGTRTGNLPTNS